jgi:hypothetical protein
VRLGRARGAIAVRGVCALAQMRPGSWLRHKQTSHASVSYLWQGLHLDGAAWGQAYGATNNAATQLGITSGDPLHAPSQALRWRLGPTPWGQGLTNFRPRSPGL